jgi:hypothetical protein
MARDQYIIENLQRQVSEQYEEIRWLEIQLDRAREDALYAEEKAAEKSFDLECIRYRLQTCGCLQDYEGYIRELYGDIELLHSKFDFGFDGVGANGKANYNLDVIEEILRHSGFDDAQTLDFCVCNNKLVNFIRYY